MDEINPKNKPEIKSTSFRCKAQDDWLVRVRSCHCLCPRGRVPWTRGVRRISPAVCTHTDTHRVTVCVAIRWKRVARVLSMAPVRLATTRSRKGGVFMPLPRARIVWACACPCLCLRARKATLAGLRPSWEPQRWKAGLFPLCQRATRRLAGLQWELERATQLERQERQARLADPVACGIHEGGVDGLGRRKGNPFSIPNPHNLRCIGQTKAKLYSLFEASAVKLRLASASNRCPAAVLVGTPTPPVLLQRRRTACCKLVLRHVPNTTESKRRPQHTTGKFGAALPIPCGGQLVLAGALQSGPAAPVRAGVKRGVTLSCQYQTGTVSRPRPPRTDAKAAACT